MVNYERLGLGWMAEAVKFLTGAPSYKYDTKDYSAD
jgi:hypothetical protein